MLLRLKFRPSLRAFIVDAPIGREHVEGIAVLQRTEAERVFAQERHASGINFFVLEKSSTLVSHPKDCSAKYSKDDDTWGNFLG